VFKGEASPNGRASDEVAEQSAMENHMHLNNSKFILIRRQGGGGEGVQRGGVTRWARV